MKRNESQQVADVLREMPGESEALLCIRFSRVKRSDRTYAAVAYVPRIGPVVEAPLMWWEGGPVPYDLYQDMRALIVSMFDEHCEVRYGIEMELPL